MGVGALLTVQGIDLHVDGEGPQTIVMVHGWPDTWRLWDGTVDVLKAQYRCVRFSLPGFDVQKPPRPTSLDQMVDLFKAILDAVSPDQPVTLMLHDWGCMFGYEFAMRYPGRVARIVGLDIGDHNSPELRRALGPVGRRKVFTYQMWLALAWKLGGAVGNRITRWQMRVLRCPADPATVGWQMNYPYAMKWLGALGGLRGTAPVAPQCPMLFIYGSRKFFMFHSPEWLARIAARPGCAVKALATGHWVMLGKKAEFDACVVKWLNQVPTGTTARNG